MSCSFLTKWFGFTSSNFSVQRVSGYALSLFFPLHVIRMANRQLMGFKSARATSPLVPAIPQDSPLHERYLPHIAEDDQLVPIKITFPSAHQKRDEIGTSNPPSKEFKLRSLRTYQSFSQRRSLLPPEELARSHTHAYSLDTQKSSLRSPNHFPNQTTLSKASHTQDREQTATMPYNNTAIPPPEEITGAASLPC